jgi:hypothetical protein
MHVGKVLVNALMEKQDLSDTGKCTDGETGFK